MPDQIAQTKLSPFTSPGARVRIYRVLSVFLENGIPAGQGVSALLHAAEAAKADKASRELAEPLRGLLDLIKEKPQLGAVLAETFGTLSAEEAAILSVLPHDGAAAGRMLARVADIVESLKPVR